MSPTRVLKSFVALLTLAVLVSCGKKEEPKVVAPAPQVTETAKLIDETKRSAEALNAGQAGTGAAPPYAQLPALLDQLASHLEARTQARQQGTDTATAHAQVTRDLTQLQEIQKNIAAAPAAGAQKPALDQLNENLAKLILLVNQGQELKAALNPVQSGIAAPSGSILPTSAVPAGSPKGADATIAAASAPAPNAPAPDAVPSSCCAIVPNPEMKGRLGRLIVSYPVGTSSNARIGVSKENKEVASGHGNKTFDLLPGDYAVVISGKRVDIVTIKSGHDTNVKVGVLRVSSSGNARISILDKDGKTEIAFGHGNRQFGLPVGTVHVKVAGQTEAVTIEENKITDF